MDEKDRTIQQLRRELQEIVKTTRACRYCKFRDADCTPTGPECKPEWRGLKA